MLATKQYRLAKLMKLAGRTIGILAAVFAILTLATPAFAETRFGGWRGATTAETIITAALSGLGLLACLLSWRYERFSSALLVITSLGFAIHIAVFAAANEGAWKHC